ncbi:PaaI family thioesterase [Afifella sp. IM 167]|uniref:PaaI family thioesterase n=1 Tax=Afifella sp. IM 167 TaxID=2033586 RepID=UPI001CCB8D9B|nr:PaaI family thioesterase [Afifella sp. IM 167]
MAYDPASDGWTVRPSNAFMQSIGTLWERSADGKTDLGILCEPRHDNGFARMHGALIATLADQGLALAALEARNAGSASPLTLSDQATIHLDLHFLGGVEIGAFLYSRCEVTRQTRSMSFARGLLIAGGETVCSAQGTFKLLRREQAGAPSRPSTVPPRQR